MNPPPSTRSARRSPQVLLGWCVWLLISWGVNLWIDPPLHAPVWGTAEVLTPAVRGMIQSLIVGLGLIWPAWRLSQVGGGGWIVSPGREIASDLTGMMLIAQAMVWLLRLLMGWPVPYTALIALTLIVWAVAFGVCVWAGRLGGSGGRMVAMIACVLLLAGGWLLTAATGRAAFAAWSPMHVLWVLIDTPRAIDPIVMIQRLLTVFALSAAAWLLLLARRQPRGTSPAEARGASGDAMENEPRP